MAHANPPQPAPQLGPQPDFARLGQVFEQAATDLRNFANLPPFAQGNALMQQMQQQMQQTREFQQQMNQMQQQVQQTWEFQQQMQQQMNQMQQQMNQMQQQMNQNFTAVRNDIKINHRATEYNSIVRLRNAAARTADYPLTALRDYTTNTDIPEFPATPLQLANMTAVRLDPILESLDLPVNGTVITKRQRLRFYIGLPEMPQ